MMKNLKNHAYTKNIEKNNMKNIKMKAEDKEFFYFLVEDIKNKEISNIILNSLLNETCKFSSFLLYTYNAKRSLMLTENHIHEFIDIFLDKLVKDTTCKKIYASLVEVLIRCNYVFKNEYRIFFITYFVHEEKEFNKFMRFNSTCRFSKSIKLFRTVFLLFYTLKAEHENDKTETFYDNLITHRKVLTDEVHSFECDIPTTIKTLIDLYKNNKDDDYHQVFLNKRVHNLSSLYLHFIFHTNTELNIDVSLSDGFYKLLNMIHTHEHNFDDMFISICKKCKTNVDKIFGDNDTKYLLENIEFSED